MIYHYLYEEFEWPLGPKIMFFFLFVLKDKRHKEKNDNRGVIYFTSLAKPN